MGRDRGIGVHPMALQGDLAESRGTDMWLACRRGWVNCQTQQLKTGLYKKHQSLAGGGGAGRHSWLGWHQGRGASWCTEMPRVLG